MVNFLNDTIHTCVDGGVFEFIRGTISEKLLLNPLIHPLSRASYRCVCITQQTLLEAYPNASKVCLTAGNLLFDYCITKYQPIATKDYVRLAMGVGACAVVLSLFYHLPAPHVLDPPRLNDAA